MSIGHNIETEYVLCGRKLDNTDMEKDLGIWVTTDMKSSLQCKKAATKALGVLASIKRTFKNVSVEAFKILYGTYIRPHLEYCAQAWCPFQIKDIEILEKVQRRATKMVRCISKLPYEDRLRRLNLFSLRYRRIRGDMIETFKILKGIEDVDSRQFFQLSGLKQLRGHSLKLYQKSNRTELSKNFFSQRVVPVWNRLPTYVVQASTVSEFKYRLDLHRESLDVDANN
jgi:hypothetical protein